MPIFPFPPLSGASLPVTPERLALTTDECIQMTGFLRSLVQTPSPSTQEGAVANLILDELKAVGVSDVHIDRVGNVVARLGDGPGPTLLIDAHMDTVAPTASGWPYAPYEAAVQDGFLYGLGACDMKGSIAAVVYAVKRLIESGTPLHGTLALAFVVQQEPCEGCALRALMDNENIRPDWILLAEPSNMTVKRGHRGRVLFKVTVHGRSSHGSRPDLGENAVVGAARLIFGIDLLSAGMAADPFLGSGSIAVTHIESSAPSANAIPDKCVFYVDRRLTVGETATRAQMQIQTVIDREGLEATVEIAEYMASSYTGYAMCIRQAFNAWALDPDHPLIAMMSRAIRSCIGQEPEVGHWAFSTDGVYSMGELGIPTVGFGPGNPDYAHTVNEQVRLDDVARAAQVYALMVSMSLSG